MYLVRITDKKKDYVDYPEDSIQKAYKRFAGLLKEAKEDWWNVSIIDNTMTVLCMAPVIGGKSRLPVAVKDLVKIKDAYLTPEEKKREDVYVVVQMNEWRGSVDIACLTTNLVLNPIESVGVEMVESIGTCEKEGEVNVS